jgi:hypothetical protein
MGGGFNVTSDQQSYDLVFKDIIINSVLGTTSNGRLFNYNLSTDNINQIYKAEVVSASIKFNNGIPQSIKNNSLILSIPQLNGNTTLIAGNAVSLNPAVNQVYDSSTNTYYPVEVSSSTTSQGNNTVTTQIFCQIPDNNTPLGNLNGNDTISLYANGAFYNSIQFYNPPLSKINQLSVSWYGQYDGPFSVGPQGDISSFYFTLRVHYFQKRNSTTAFSTNILTNAATGTLNSIFTPIDRS